MPLLVIFWSYMQIYSGAVVAYSYLAYGFVLAYMDCFIPSIFLFVSIKLSNGLREVDIRVLTFNHSRNTQSVTPMLDK